VCHDYVCDDEIYHDSVLYPPHVDHIHVFLCGFDTRDVVRICGSTRNEKNYYINHHVEVMVKCRLTITNVVTKNVNINILTSILSMTNPTRHVLNVARIHW
jgi:hypothetical protein